MSVNVNLFVRVADLADVEEGGQVVDAVLGVLRKHGIDRDVEIENERGDVIASTPYPLIISRFHVWREEFEADLGAAVAAAAPRARAEVDWQFPDGE
jgi:hypothetical protein